MRVNGEPTRTIRALPDGAVEIIDQTRLPWSLERTRLARLEDAARAISGMQVRGAPLIGVTAAYGLALALRDDPSDAALEAAAAVLLATRPTAINLAWALARTQRAVRQAPPSDRAEAAFLEASAIAEEDVATCRRIGEVGAALIEQAACASGGRPVQVLTHCNAGWLACVDWGTATAPIYVAREMGIDVHVWVGETRPRNQGALTAFELGHEGVEHTVIVDNVGGHLMQRGHVDLCLVGADRVTRTGDVANKIGTYLKALAAYDNGVPFYVAAPASTVDWRLVDGVAEIPIEERDAAEVTHLHGRPIVAPGSSAANFGFDVTPARLVTGLVTERGICRPDRLASLFPDEAAA
nr:methylthioribose-1-phosphate isomerase [uncultured bacterium]